MTSEFVVEHNKLEKKREERYKVTRHRDNLYKHPFTTMSYFGQEDIIVLMIKNGLYIQKDDLEESAFFVSCNAHKSLLEIILNKYELDFGCIPISDLKNWLVNTGGSDIGINIDILGTSKLLIDKICEQETDKEKRKKIFNNCVATYWGQEICWGDDEIKAYIKSMCEEDFGEENLDISQRKRRKLEN